jgi:molybdopterin/thiamine biosynthesis adenylyltransferase
MLPEVGEAGQARLLAARVLVIGAGGLGSAVIPYLAAAGVGHIGMIDGDRVELSNLARQVIHETGDIGRLKVESARDRVGEINPDCAVTIYPFALTAGNAAEIIDAYDIVADGCDNFASRFIVNQTCIVRRVPLVSAAIAGWDGQVMTVAPHLVPGSACYQCVVHADAPEANTCRESGVIGPLAGVVGSMQALEVVRVALGMPALIGKLVIYDGLAGTQRVVVVQQDSICPVCKSS